MFLVCTTDQSFVKLQNLCMNQQTLNEVNDKINIQLKLLPLIQLQELKENIQWVEDNINLYDYVILLSPNAIRFCETAIRSALNSKFITVGEASANSIKKLSSNAVLYPENGSGLEAMIDEVLSSSLQLNNSKILVLQGDYTRDNLDDYFKINKINAKSVIIYYHNALPIESEAFKNYLSSVNLQGIIITSSIFVKYILDQARQAECEDLVKSLTYLVLHPNIKAKLGEHEIQQITVSETASYESLVALIRSKY